MSAFLGKRLQFLCERLHSFVIIYLFPVIHSNFTDITLSSIICPFTFARIYLIDIIIIVIIIIIFIVIVKTSTNRVLKCFEFFN